MSFVLDPEVFEIDYPNHDQESAIVMLNEKFGPGNWVREPENDIVKINENYNALRFRVRQEVAHKTWRCKQWLTFGHYH